VSLYSAVMGVRNVRQLPRSERRQSILEGAGRAFTAAGFAATSMEAIAEEAGVSKLLLYRHFESKAELYRSVLEQVLERSQEQFAAALATSQGPAVYARAFTTVARENPEGFRLLWRHAAREPDFTSYAAEVRAEVVRYAEGVLAPFVVDPTVLGWAAETIVAFLVEAVLAWLERGDPQRDDEFVSLVTHSLEALVRTWANPCI
jgi:AcrR family transcriptional regulator